MRVTNQLVFNTITSNLFKNTERLYQTQNILSSGKRINRPADDPTGMAHVLDYRQSIAIIEQYSRNIQRGESWLSQTDATLGSVDELLMRAKELAVYQATETSTAQTRAIAAKEIKNIHDQLMQLANTKVDQSYIFAGHQTDISPYYLDIRLGSQGVDQTIFALDATETWTISVGANSFTVDVATGDSLAAVRDAIEAADDAAGNLVTVDIVNDGSSSNPDRLVLTANWAAGDRQISVSGNTSNLSFSAADPTTLIDAAEPGTGWTGTATVTSGGSYTGTSNKTLRFDITSVTGGGSVGTDAITLHWSDGAGAEGNSTLDGSYVPGSMVTIAEGMEISLSAGTVVAGDTFSVDLWHPNLNGTYATYHGDDGDMKVIVGKNSTLDINVTGTEVFGSTVDIFAVLHDLQSALEDNDTEGISNQIEPLGEALKQTGNVRADAGSRLNRLEVTRNYWDAFLLKVTGKLSETEDADIAKTVADLTSQEAVYQASLAAAAKMLQPSLLDFLR